MTEIEKVAAGLTEAQRAEVLSLSGEWTVRKWAGQRPPWEVWLPPYLLEQGCPASPKAQRLRLTPLGLRVRAHLKGQRNG